MRQASFWRRAGRLLLFGAGLSLSGAAAAPAYQQDNLGELRLEEARRQSDHVALRILGRVREPREAGRRFMVETPEARFQVEYDRSGRPGFGVRPLDLEEGDRVVVYGRLLRDQRVLADRVVLVTRGEVTPEPRRLIGEVRLIDRRRNRLTVRDGDSSIVEVEYTGRTVFARLGRRATSDDLQRGDTIWAEGIWQGPDHLLASRIEITAGSGWRDGDLGEVVEINPRGTLFQVRFGRETRRVDGWSAQYWHAGRPLSPSTIRPGARVRVYGEAHGVTIRARRVEMLENGPEIPTAVQTVEARVRLVDPGAQRIWVVPYADSPDYREIHVTATTTIFRNGRRVTLRDLQTGDRIRARGTEREGRFRAEVIETLR